MRQGGNQTFAQISVSSLGFTAVAFFSALAGYALARPGFVQEGNAANDIVLILIYVALLVPYYISRQALLERSIKTLKAKFDSYAISVGIQVPLIMLFLLLLTLLFAAPKIYSPSKQYFLGQWEDVVISLFLGIIPFYLLLAKTRRDLKKPDSDQAFKFSEKVFLPALATGIVPFSFGWSIKSEHLEISGLLSASIYVLLLSILPSTVTLRFSGRQISLRAPKIMVATSILVLLIFTSFIYTEANLQGLIFGSLITFAMGVSETAKRVYISSLGRTYTPPREGTDYFVRGANWSSVVFPTLVLFAPLIADDLPIIPIFTFMALQILVWVNLTDEYKKSQGAYILGLAFGYGLPALIILTNLTSSSRQLQENSGFSAISFIPPILIAIGVLVLNTYNLLGEFRSFLDNFSDSKIYRKRQNAYYLFFSVIVILITIVFIIGTFFASAEVETRANTIIGLSSFLIMAVGTSFFVRYARRRPIKSKAAKNS